LVLLLGSSVTGTDGFDAKSEEVAVVHGRQLTAGCSNACIGYPSYSSDGYCDDGGPGAAFSSCQLGTDCTDCGSRAPLPLGTRWATTVAQLTAAINNSAISKIVVQAGTYDLSSALSISRAVTIEAEMAGSVVLNGRSQTRVFDIASSGVAQLIGLNITGGYANSVLLAF